LTPGSCPPPPHRPWCFPPAGERREHFDRGIPKPSRNRQRTPRLCRSRLHWLTIAFVFRPNEETVLHVGGQDVVGPSPSSVTALRPQDRPLPRGPLLRRLVAAPPSPLVRPQLPRSDVAIRFPLLVIRMALPYGCVLADAEASPFHHRPFSTCHALRPRGARRMLLPSSSPPVAAFARQQWARHSQ